MAGLTAAALLMVVATSCAGPVQRSADTGSRARGDAHPPTELIGSFEDDYGIRYSIGPARWQQGSGILYHVVEWDRADRTAIARNDDSNPSDGGKWTRIDWIFLEDMAPYTWAYCLTVYDAESREAAESASPADAATPRTGCNGFPFSRMRPLGR